MVMIVRYAYIVDQPPSEQKTWSRLATSLRIEEGMKVKLWPPVHLAYLSFTTSFSIACNTKSWPLVAPVRGSREDNSHITTAPYLGVSR
jgi:hypothetical protein